MASDGTPESGARARAGEVEPGPAPNGDGVPITVALAAAAFPKSVYFIVEFRRGASGIAVALRDAVTDR
jgi:hypothetical protein